MEKLKDRLYSADSTLICLFQRISTPLARLSLFVVFFWFGILKTVAESPANPLVSNLLQKTLPFIGFETFIILFGVFEMIIGVVFLIPKLERLALPLLLIHMGTTALPLIFLTSQTWQSFLIPTLEGQYIVKNLVIIALAISLSAQLKPLEKKKSPPKFTPSPLPKSSLID